MKCKQSNPKSVRPNALNLSTNVLMGNINKRRVRCSLCDALLKAPLSHRYLIMGKSVHDRLTANDPTSITYGQCCERYVNDTYEFDKMHMICLKCCSDLKRAHSLHTDMEQLKVKICHSWQKTKRLNRARNSVLTPSPSNSKSSDGTFSIPPAITDEADNTIVIKEEMMVEHVPLPVVQKRVEEVPSVPELSIPITDYERLSHPQDALYAMHYQNSFNSTVQPYVNSRPATKAVSKKKINSQLQHPQSTMTNDELNALNKLYSNGSYTQFLSTQIPRPTPSSQHKYCHNYLCNHPTVPETPPMPYSQLMIDPPSASTSPVARQRNNSNSEQPPLIINCDRTLDEEQSLSPRTNDDETSSIVGSKTARLSRRQYDFLKTLPDQQSLNEFIESSSSQYGSRWTWRRTSANSRGYKVYYVCNFSMRRHYLPCPAAMYALFQPDGSISIYACGDHQHVPKDRIPVSITDESKEEIFKCLQANMSTTEIREHLTRLQLPFGDTRKLNNFIKYHKELLRFGTVTNVRVGGTAYRQPQCWAIRRQPPPPAPPSAS